MGKVLLEKFKERKAANLAEKPKKKVTKSTTTKEKTILVTGRTVGDHGLLLGVLVQDLLGDDDLALALKPQPHRR